MTSIKTYKDLIVWQKALELSVLVYQLTNKFPKNEMFGLTMQVRRAVISISSNIAEGNGRGTYGKDYRQFLRIARGSLQEVETQVILARRLNYIFDSELEKNIFDLMLEIQKMLNVMISRH